MTIIINIIYLHKKYFHYICNLKTFIDRFKTYVAFISCVGFFVVKILNIFLKKCLTKYSIFVTMHML